MGATLGRDDNKKLSRKKGHPKPPDGPKYLHTYMPERKGCQRHHHLRPNSQNAPALWNQVAVHQSRQVKSAPGAPARARHTLGALGESKLAGINTRLRFVSSCFCSPHLSLILPLPLDCIPKIGFHLGPAAALGRGYLLLYPSCYRYFSCQSVQSDATQSLGRVGVDTYHLSVTRREKICRTAKDGIWEFKN